MNNVEKALVAINDELPVKRDILTDEYLAIRDIAKEKAAARPGGVSENILFDAIWTAFDYGFWKGWKHCEAECEYTRSLKVLMEIIDGCTPNQIQEAKRLLETIKKG